MSTEIQTESLDFLRKQSAEDLVERFVTHSEMARSAAVRAAKALIALVDVLKSEDAARKAVKKAGASDCTVKNAMQLVWAYDAVVRPGHADEKWFDELLYAHAVAVRAAIAKVGIAKVCDAKLFAKPAKALLVEFELLAETGMTRPEREAAKQKEIDDKLAAEKKAKEAAAKTPATPEPPKGPPATPADVAGLVAAKGGAKATKTLAEEFDAILKGAESFIEKVVAESDDVTVEALKTRAAGFLVKVNAAVEARAAKVKAAA